MKRTVLTLILTVFVGSSVSAADQESSASAPPNERMFFALIEPDSTASLQITCPSTLTAGDDWWHDCGKFFSLTSEKQTPGPNALKDAWHKSKDQTAHLVLDADMTYENWSSGPLDLRDGIRTRLLERVQKIVAQNRVFEILNTMTAQEDAVSIVLEQLQRILRTEDTALFHYCPGVVGNIAVNTRHPLFGKLPSPEQNPAFASLMKDVGVEYTKRLQADKHMDAEARQRVLDDLLAEKEVLSRFK